MALKEGVSMQMQDPQGVDPPKKNQSIAKIIIIIRKIVRNRNTGHRHVGGGGESSDHSGHPGLSHTHTHTQAGSGFQ